ncbi:MAG: Ig-like domain-containing protein, partial [Methylophilaceae bacterium]|nr:Ig-like domain-containing protein [Methylophilaceae bacterium]
AYTVNVMATDAAGNTSASSPIVVNVTDVNEAPMLIRHTAGQIVIVNRAFSLDVANTFSDPDSVNTYPPGTPQWGTLTYTALGLPVGFSISSSGIITGTATSALPSTTVTVIATDGGGLTVSDSFELRVLTAPDVKQLTALSNNTKHIGKEGDALTLSLNMSEAVVVLGVPQIALSVNGQNVTASYASGSGGDTLIFTAMVPSGDGASISIASVSIPSGGSVIGQITNANWDTSTVSLVPAYQGYTVDNTPPIATTLSLASDTGSLATDSITSNPTINVLGLESAASWRYRVDNGVWVQQNARLSSFTATSGAHTYAVQQIDEAGNLGAVSSMPSYTLLPLAVAPVLSLASDTGSSHSDHITLNETILVGGLDTNTISWQYQLDGGEWVLGGASAFIATSGTHTYSVRQVDLAGNTSAPSLAVSYTLDTTPPAIPTLTLAGDTGLSASDSLTSNPTINVLGLELAAGTTWVFQVDGTAGPWLNGTGTSFTATTGAHTYFVRQFDVAGNSRGVSTAVTYTLDTSLPVMPTLSLASDTGSSSSDGLTNNATINVLGLEPAAGTTWAFQVDGTAGAWINGTGTDFIASTGAHTYFVRQTDVAGNVSPLNTVVYTLDIIPPLVPSLSLVSDTGSSSSDGLTNNATVNVLGLESAAGTNWQYQVDGTSGSWITGTGTSFIATSGAHTYFVRQFDVAGNSSGVSTAVPYTLDTSLPAMPTLSLASDTGANSSDGLTNNSTINVLGLELTTGTTWAFQVDSTAGEWVNGTGTSFIASTGAHTYFVRQTDVAGNVSPLNTAVYTLDTSLPVMPTLSLVSDTGNSSSDGLTKNSIINVLGLETASGTSWQYQVDGTAAGSWVAGTGTTFTAT